MKNPAHPRQPNQRARPESPDPRARPRKRKRERDPKGTKGDTIWPVAHFFWGYSVCLPLFFLILWLAKRDVKVPTVRKFFTLRAPVGALGGIWAMIPDIDYFLDEHIFDKSWADIFLFHRSFDVVLPESDLFFAAEMFLLFAVVNLFVMAGSVETFERVNEALFGKREEEDEEEDFD